MSLLKNTLFITILLAISYCSQPESDYYSKDPNKYKYASGIACDETTNCKSPNYCSNAKDACHCDKGLANYPFSGYKGEYCTYKQKKQKTSFLWELLTNIGIGHFIIGDHLAGTFKLVMMLIPIVIQILGLANIVKVGFSHGNTATAMQCISIAFGVGCFVWWLVDAIRFGTNKIRDDLDVPLAHW